MGKTYTPQPITSETNFKLTLNNNLDAIETALDLALSRGGETPNQMNADIDLNSNDLLNVGNIVLESSLKQPKVIAGDYTLEHDDLYRVLRVTQEAEITFPDTDEFQAGWYCHIQKATDDFVTFTSSDTIEAVMDSREILEKWGFITPLRLSASSWAVSGNLA